MSSEEEPPVRVRSRERELRGDLSSRAAARRAGTLSDWMDDTGDTAGLPNRPSRLTFLWWTSV